ncbi:MAG: globin [Dehalococcoidia bacterium]
MESPFVVIGGNAGVSALVEEFYRRIEADTAIRPVYPDDLEPGKEKLKLFLGQWLGGPAAYSERYGHPRLRRRHFPFIIEPLHAGLWLKHMRAAVQEQGIPDEVERIMFERLSPLAHHMVNAGEDLPRGPITETWMD